MTMINTPLVLLAQQCGGTFHTPGPKRTIRGMCFTFEQLETLANKLRSVDAMTRSGALQSVIGEHKDHETQ